jgi:hypothetical protein
MNHENKTPEDAKLRALVREGRPVSGLPPGFQNAVWRRIERKETAPQSRWLDALAGWLFRPRFAAASLAAVMLLGGASGALTQARIARLDAQSRYVAAVDPFQKQP